jgi:hypothetical protein
MNGNPLVQVQTARIVALDDLDVLVERLILMKQSCLGLDRPGRHREKGGDRRRREQPAPAEEEAPGQGDHGRAQEQRPLGADQRDRHECREERPEQAADR